MFRRTAGKYKLLFRRFLEHLQNII